MEVRSNVVNQVRLLRSNTFADPLAFVDELVQNAQCAGAENLDITVEDDRISFRDDGTGLGEGGPEKLFTLHDSDWKTETALGQKPFGIGFFAVVAVANTVTVRSNQYRISFDVAKLVEQGDTNAVVVTEDPEHPQPGFEVVLTDLIGTQDREAIIFPKGFKFAPDRADAMPVYKVCATLQEAQAVAAAKTAHAAIVGEPVKYVAFDPEEVMELNIIRYEQVHGRSWRSTEEYLRWSSGADNWADEPYSGEAPGQSVERLEALYSTDEGDDDGLPF